MEAPRLLFGIGATKAGTSWLYDYLRGHPECAMPRMKELHFFNSLSEKGHAWRLKVLAGKHADLSAKLVGAPAPRQAALTLRLDEIERYMAIVRSKDVEGYKAFLDGVRGDKALVGDVTPAYALLPEDRLSEMSKMGPAVRFIYLLRDPVDRLWSNIRMVAHRKSQANGRDVSRIANRLLDKVLSGDDKETFARSDYAGNIQRLSRAVPKSQVLIEFFETLFTPEAMTRVCDFLGIGYSEPAFAKTVHGGKASLKLDADRRAAARHFLQPQYDYVSARMGDVPARWQRG